jgi:hypothetical protein
MSRDSTWEELATELAQLKETAPDALRYAVERVEQLTTLENNPYRPEALALVVAGLREASEKLAQGQPPDEVLQEASEAAGARFEQELSAETVNNAQNIFNIALGDRPRSQGAPDAALAPIVLAVVTEAQAAELVNGTAFDDYPQMLRDHFDQIRSLLTADEALGDWRERYGDTAFEWRPFGSNATIVDLVKHAVSEANQAFTFTRRLEPELIDIAAVNDDRPRLRRLRQLGCVVIVDSLSMRHPALQRAFHHSLLDAYPSTSVVVVAPTKNMFAPARCLSVVLQLQLQDLEFAKRRLDVWEEEGMSAETAEANEFETWIGRQVKRLAPAVGAPAGVRAYMQYGTGD